MQKTEKNHILSKTRKHIKNTLLKETTGHDWWHTQRVTKTALYLAVKEGGDAFTIELSSLFHDIKDWKFNNGDNTLSSKYAKDFLSQFDLEASLLDHICKIISNVSFKGSGVKNKIKTLEGKIVQDADRLDALGAIGIARAFAYGGSKKRSIYNPLIKPQMHKTFEEYKASEGHTINHFYEKLLLLKDAMNTKTGKKIAEKRHKFMETFLKNFFIEWEGKDIL